jgi:hypothetical protein
MTNRQRNGAQLCLNRHLNSAGEPYLKIEKKRSGIMTIWRADADMSKMEEAKRYLEKVWGYNAC